MRGDSSGVIAVGSVLNAIAFSSDSGQAWSAFPALAPDGLLKARQYLYGTALLAAESFDPSLEPPAPILVCYHLAALGSIVNLTDDSGAVEQSYLYDAWGNYRELDVDGACSAWPDLDENGFYAWEYYLDDIQSAFTQDFNRLTYTGHEFDPETGLCYFKARFFDPEIGRFSTADAYLGDIETPTSLHRYLYANSSPLTYRDLTGCISVKDATVEFLTGLGEVVAEPVNLAVDMVIMGGVAIHQTTADYPMYAEHLRFHSMTARAQQARLAAGTSRLTTGLEGLYSLEANLATLGLGGISEAMIGQYRAYRAGWIGYDEFNRRMSRLSGNIVGGAAFLKMAESSANSGRGGGGGRVHQRAGGRAVDDQVWVEDATIVPRAKGTIPTEETSSASRSATAQAETIIEKSAPRNPGGGARTTAEPSSVNETTGSLTAKTPVGEGQAKNGGMKALPPGQKPIAELPPGQIKPLKENLGPKPSSMTKPQAHHDMPQSLRDQFKKAGFNIEDPRFGRWVEGGPVGNHQKWSKAFNDEWRQFFETNRNPSYDDVINKTNQLRQDPRFQ